MPMKAVGMILLGMAAGTVSHLNAQVLTSQDLQREIKLYENTLAKVKPGGFDATQIGRLWLHLATFYQDAGRYEQSQKAYIYAAHEFKTQPSPLDLAAAIDGLGTLYLQEGNVRDAEREELKALRLREGSGQKSDLARSWGHLAVLYLRKRHAALARDYAERAASEVLSEADAQPEDKISALFTLSFALGFSRQYSAAFDNLQNALHLAKQVYRADDFPVGFGTFLLGYTHWKAGDVELAGELMRQGTEIMGRQLGWSNPAYRSVMTLYAGFLRKTHQHEASQQIEREIELARSKSGEDSLQNPTTIDVAAFF